MNCLAIDASEKLIANRKLWGLQRQQSLNQLLLACHDWREEKCFPEEDFHKSQHSFYKGISSLRPLDKKGLQLLSISEYMKKTIFYLRHPRLKQLPEDGISCLHSKLQFLQFLALTKQYQKKRKEKKKNKCVVKIAHVSLIQINDEVLLSEPKVQMRSNPTSQ